MKHIAIIGAGAWGTALATVCAHNGYHIKLWCFDATDAKNINEHHENTRYLPNIKLDQKITATTDLQEALLDTQWIIEAVPVQYLRSILIRMQPHVTSEQSIIISSKGIEQETLLFPSQMISDIFTKFSIPQVIISGPTFAKDLAEKKLSGITIASTHHDTAIQAQKLITTDFLRTDLSADIVGVQAGGALKNIIAVGMGILDGTGYGQNSCAYFLTRGLQEIVQLTQALGGYAETLYGLAGIGDLVLTTMGNQSRNREVGRQIGQGKSLQAILADTGFVPEGINSVLSVHQLMRKKNIDLPIMRGIYEIIFLNKNTKQFVRDCTQ